MRVALVAVVGTLLLAGGVDAKRPPRLAERAAITHALPAFLRNEPVGCVWLDVSVSNNGTYARVAPVYLNALRPPCVKYASNGYWLLRKRGSPAAWKIVFNGSEQPKCSLKVPRDLTPCTP